MIAGLEAIADKEYLGRVIILGVARNGEGVVVYAVTGRSPSSQARKFEQTEDGTIRTSPTDVEVLEKGNPKLLIYNCIRRFQDSLIVTNGAQTDLIYETMQKSSKSINRNPAGILVEAFSQPYLVVGNNPGESIDLTLYEPDPPNWTPRISGILGRDRMGFSIVKWNHGQADRNYFEFPLQEGRARVLATYTGQNVSSGQSLPSFEGEPWRVFVHGKTADEIAEQVYEALSPQEGKPDFRVGVAAVVYRGGPDHKISSHIINRVDKEKQGS